MKIYDFVNWELDKFRQECNFSTEELEYFNLRAKHYSNFEISMKEMMRNARSEEERESYRKTIEQLQR